MLRKLFSFLYQFLFVDQVKGHLSHTKFWSNAGYAAMTWAFVWTTYIGKTEVDYTIWIIFGAVVVGNRTLNDFLKKKKDILTKD